jgi:hypothetical protein
MVVVREVIGVVWFILAELFYRTLGVAGVLVAFLLWPVGWIVWVNVEEHLRRPEDREGDQCRTDSPVSGCPKAIFCPQVSWGFGGRMPSSAEEEAKPDDETKDLRGTRST